MNALIYSEEIATSDYGPYHPFKPERARLCYDLIHRYGLLDGIHQRVIRPDPLPEKLLPLFHDATYIDLLKKGNRGAFSPDMLASGLGTADNPVFRGLYDLALAASGGTYRAAQMVAGGEARCAFNLIGGFHHAGRDHASGFCYINDVAVTITDLLRSGLRVAYVDIDAHHGDGVQDAFYDTDRVLFISFHESGETLFPGSGFEGETGADQGRGYTVNVPLSAGTDDETYTWAFEAIVPALLGRFAADLVFAEIGGDSHRQDPLANLNLTTSGYRRVIEMINESSPRIVAMGAGGYDVPRTAALWTIAWAVFCGLEPEDHYLGRICGGLSAAEEQAARLTEPPFVLEGPAKALCRSAAEKAVSFIRDHVFPIHGL